MFWYVFPFYKQLVERIVKALPFIHQPNRMAPKASDVSLADWLYQHTWKSTIFFTFFVTVFLRAENPSITPQFMWYIYFAFTILNTSCLSELPRNAKKSVLLTDSEAQTFLEYVHIYARPCIILYISHELLVHFVIYYTHFEITGGPCNPIGSNWCDLFTNRTIFCFKSHLFPNQWGGYTKNKTTNKISRLV